MISNFDWSRESSMKLFKIVVTKPHPILNELVSKDAIREILYFWTFLKLILMRGLAQKNGGGLILNFNINNIKLEFLFYL